MPSSSGASTSTSCSSKLTDEEDDDDDEEEEVEEYIQLEMEEPIPESTKKQVRYSYQSFFFFNFFF
jgi:hypothetical protein